MAHGYLVNDADGRGRRAQIRLGDPLPDALELLPRAEAIAPAAAAETPQGATSEPPVALPPSALSVPSSDPRPDAPPEGHGCTVAGDPMEGTSPRSALDTPLPADDAGGCTSAGDFGDEAPPPPPPGPSTSQAMQSLLDRLTQRGWGPAPQGPEVADA